MVGSLVGALPLHPRQNSQLGLPLVLLPEETTLMREEGCPTLCLFIHKCVTLTLTINHSICLSIVYLRHSGTVGVCQSGSEQKRLSAVPGTEDTGCSRTGAVSLSLTLTMTTPSQPPYTQMLKFVFCSGLCTGCRRRSKGMNIKFRLKDRRGRVWRKTQQGKEQSWMTASWKQVMDIEERVVRWCLVGHMAATHRLTARAPFPRTSAFTLVHNTLLCSLVIQNIPHLQCSATYLICNPALKHSHTD